MSVDDPRRGRQSTLADTLGFSQEDLESNRSGGLSADQRDRIIAKNNKNSRFAWIATALLLGIGLFGMSVEVIRSGDADGQALAVYAGVNVAIIAVVRATIGRVRMKMRRALEADVVGVVEGKIRVITVRGEKLMIRYFCVGAHRFQVQRHRDYITLKNLGVDGHEATAFVLTGRHELLSVELR